MIEKMKQICVVTSAPRKNEMLSALRKLGILHLSEKKSASRETTERFAALSRAQMALADYKPEKGTEAEILPDEEFEAVFQRVQTAMEKKAGLIQERGAAATEADRIAGWGEFSPKE